MFDTLYGQATAQQPCPPLSGETVADVCVIGGGITGISTALHLALAGRSVVLLEAEAIGFGASGRNGGQVNPGLKTTPDEVVRDFGPEIGQRLAETAWNAPDRVFALIARYNSACAAVRGGTIRAATAGSQIAALKALAGQCAQTSNALEWLDAGAIAARTGTRRYQAGLLDRRGGQIDPLSYTRGLARAAMQEGARLYAHTRVRKLARHGLGWTVDADGGRVRAGAVVIATNGYSDGLLPKLRRSIVPVYSAIIASQRLPEALARSILPEREVVYELGTVTTYYRRDAQNRLLIGGRSQSRSVQGAHGFAYLARRARGLWPELGSLGWTHGWNGQLAMTTDHYPHWHNPERGLYAVLGYNGRGVAMATISGQALSDHLVHGAPPLFPFTPIRPIPFHAFWKAGVIGRIALGRVQDGLSGLTARRDV